MLSRRIIYFVDNKVYFRCRSTVEFEHADPRPDGRLSFRKQHPFQRPSYSHILLADPILDFNEMVALYSKRALTYQADALNAMRGIVRRVSDKMACRFVEGIPTAAVDLVIIFRRAYGSQLRRREDFPSYSWTGWMGAMVMIPQVEGFPIAHRMNKWLTTNTWIIWHMRTPQGIRAPLWDYSENLDFPWHDINYVGYRERERFNIPGCDIDANRTVPTTQFSPDRAPADATTPARGYHLLEFWTLSVFFHLREIDTEYSTASLWDPVDHGACGYVYLDGLEDTRFYEDTSSDRSFELIVLSKANPASFAAEFQGIRFSFLGGSGPLYNVMLLEWMGSVAERRGLGLISQSSLTHSLAPGPVWKEILLG